MTACTGATSPRTNRMSAPGTLGYSRLLNADPGDALVIGLAAASPNCSSLQQQPIHRVVLISDEAVDAGGGEVLGLHGEIIPVPCQNLPQV